MREGEREERETEMDVTSLFLSECTGSRPRWPYLCVRAASCMLRLVWCLCLSSFFVFLLCLVSALVRTAWCLCPSPSLVLAEALHDGLFFFSSLVIHIPLLLSSCLSLLK